MEKRKIHGTSLSVSKICLGTMTFGNQNTESEGHEQMDYAFDQGVNFFDTAELYAVPSTKENQGKTEEIIGTWFKKSGKRSDVILGSKVTGPNSNIKHIRGGADDLNFKPESIKAALELSLKRLQTDYIDIYQLHWPERKTNMFGQLGYTHNPRDTWEDNFLEIIETMDALIKSGKIRHWGISNETPWGMMHFLKLAEMNNLPKPVSIQNPYCLLNRSYEVGLAEPSIRENIGLLAYSPLGFGLLTGKYHAKKDKESDRLNRFKNLARYSGTQSWEATSQYLAIAEKHGLSPTQMSLSFVTEQPFCTANIIGATNLDQLKENIGSAELKLSKSVLSELNKVHAAISNPAP